MGNRVGILRLWGRAGAALGVLGLAVGCAPIDDDPAAVERVDGRLYVSSTDVWSSPVIPVCWEETDFTTEKAWIRDAIAATWEAESMVSFSGWGQCSSSTSAGLRVHIADARGFTRGLGTKLDNVAYGVNLDSWATRTCATGWTRERCVRATAAHEFGHALGFAHEQNRGDTPSTCTATPSGSQGDTTIGQWDLMSVMNYCNPVRSGDSRLSGSDIWGVQRFYGAPKATAGVSWGSGRLDVFARGSDDSLQHRWFEGTTWHDWEGLGNTLSSIPAVESWGAGRIDVFARGSDGTLQHRYFSNGWGAWESLGGTIVGTPAVVSWGPNRLDVFARWTDGTLRHRWFSNGWGAWESLGGNFIGTPAVASWGANRLDVLVRGVDNTLQHIAFDGTSWQPWMALGGVLASSPDAVSWGPNRLDVFVRGTDNSLHRRFLDGAGWHGWEFIGGSFTSDPEVVSWGPSRLDVFARGSDGILQHNWSSGSSWGGWESLGQAITSGSDAVSWESGRLDILSRRSNGSVILKFFNGTSWGFDVKLGGNIR